ncbi:MAG: TonB-dependent receptor [Bacteroidales bacterium]|nr:MAG: TonB-dependent receptor [Bacteroidales bacterium]
MKKFCILFHLILFQATLVAQERFTLSGIITDAASGEELIGATVYIPAHGTGAASNSYGFYSISLPQGRYQLDFSYMGYEVFSAQIILNEDQTRNIELAPEVSLLEEVVVHGTGADENIRSTEISITKLDVKEVKSIPVIFGEQDVLKTIQLLPGVSTTGEGGSGYLVRGGGPGQNLILLDEAPVYNASHLLGFFSVFNSDAIKDVKLFKGGMPPEYGGRLSSVLDVKMKEGNIHKYGVSGGLGLISSRLTVEGPLKKEKGSFILSGRRTYADLFLRLSKDTLVSNNILYFYDLNIKGNYKLGEKDRIYLSGYFGRDVFKYSDVFGFDWGNATATIRWNHLFSNKLFSNSSLIFSNYNYVFFVDEGGMEFKIRSAIRDWNLKEDFQYFLRPENTLRFGMKLNYHNFIPGVVDAGEESGVNQLELTEKYALESALYLSHELKLSDWLIVNYGIRYSMFHVLGPDNVYTYDENGNVLDTVTYTRGDLVKDYYGLEPRITGTFRISTMSSVKASYVRTNQYVHLLSNTTSTTPMDAWIPSSKIVRPQRGDQVALGYFRNFRENQWEASLETYYKWMQNQIDYKNGADIYLNELVESQLVFGKGWSYGAELYVKKKTGKLHGWLSYTLSKTERKFDAIEEGRSFPAKQDRRHDVSIVTILHLGKRWVLSGTWVYYTGNAVTFPAGKYEIDGQTVNMYTNRNEHRMPSYHRMDLGVTLKGKERKRFESSLDLSVYNVYSRKNAYSIRFEEDEDDATKTVAKKLSLFPIVPSITYNFRF